MALIQKSSYVVTYHKVLADGKKSQPKTIRMTASNQQELLAKFMDGRKGQYTLDIVCTNISSWKK